jgi:GT2 family glycosyltransferase
LELNPPSSLATTLIEIPPEEFGHGRTRTLALAHVATEVVVYTTDDGSPTDEVWLTNLLLAFVGNQRLGAAFSRQVAGPGSSAAELAFRQARYTCDSFTVRMDVNRTIDLARLPLSNVSAAYRVDALHRIGGFMDGIPSSEEVAAAVRLLDEGYEVRYVANSCITHAHNYRFFEQVQRTFDAATSLEQVRRRLSIRTPPTSLASLVLLAMQMFRVSLGRRSSRALASISSDVVARAIGVVLARIARRFPKSWARGLSRQKWFYA